ncbi:iron-containing alcohol dehydrogenase [Anaeromicropila herbilytica]|uniref:Alcohol dehydrogenase n=1 Tax=Anaeromicropila herbilytica TaxID=2785025 RepID=A0A7R7IDS3_9FIRM|nr:iron-containing alcohol dehydrogenase [Anaeromicropila herbilytica]BCN30308.1 alcohol dehydrogenase [Anaeromicropila herbilytica]
MGYKFYMPPLSLMGKNCLKDAGPQIASLGLKKALIITDTFLINIGLVKKITDVLDENQIDYVLYDGVKPNPTIASVEESSMILTEHNCDFVVSIGGGSAHDCAKAVALLATNGGTINDYEGVDKSKKAALPLVTINTTAGTASEMTIFCIITDEEKHIKMAVVDKNVNPIMAINDPELMMAMPKSLTAATGMDALTHAIEAYVSTAATPVTDTCALKAISLISKYLGKAVDNGNDEEAREQMAYAEYLAGMAFNNAGLGYVHAIAHQLGGFYNLPHGVCNAVLLPHVQKFNQEITRERLYDIAKEMGIDTTVLTIEEASEKTIDSIKTLSSYVNIPSGLAELGVKEEDFSVLAENALKDACGLTNPKKASLEDIILILKAAM